ncbi:MAG: hypothetical protein KGJ23_00765 [Euryarchaeota archaeon]|nr:hypothetical protein [Euryarchaeota archaeon]MDE1835127.1 hypothetical protein [Euryarchaeota archaeon]MDE1880687.1 hypothetical protein [Euryarchaeota archaeon]MDE2044910.1 hypothetical protein [Thermoplasmata archaeon]
MAKGIDQTALDNMAAAKVRQQQAEAVARIVKIYEGQPGIPVAKVIQLKAVLMGITSSGGQLSPFEQGATQNRWTLDQLLSSAEQYRKTLRPAIPKEVARAPTRPAEPAIVPCYRCKKLVQVGETQCQFCRTPLVWRGNANGPYGG